jgi:hypothetical protein
MISYRFISLIDVQLSADAVVFFVKEINLVRQLFGHLFVSVLLVLHVELL